MDSRWPMIVAGFVIAFVVAGVIMIVVLVNEALADRNREQTMTVQILEPARDIDFL